ncbi:MAG: SPFH domain-containing protein, partial [Lachnospiraceae bacterium]|nr:SPFH domain-containing protein [Lachnospiraceae bacterium]
HCGARRPEQKAGWDCACGQKGNTGNFCSNCGAKKPENDLRTWDCTCGQKGNTGNFCSNCGKKRGE